MNSAAQSRLILLVEDNAMDIDLALQAFQEASISNPVLICRDGQEALDFMLAHASLDDPRLPVLVLLDLQLPKVDGLEVLRQARQHPVWKQIPFIALTTSREDCDIARAYQLGINSYIVKPLNFDAFVEVTRAIKAYWLRINQPPFRRQP